MIHYSGHGLKSVLSPMRAALYDFDAASVQRALADSFAENAVLHISHPFGDLSGPAELFEQAYLPLANSFPDLERRDLILAAGQIRRGLIGWGPVAFIWAVFWPLFWPFPRQGSQLGFAIMNFSELRMAELLKCRRYGICLN